MDGTLIAGKYRIGRRIGAGGMGAVFEATNEFTHRRVAVKVLTKELLRPADGSSSDLSESIDARYDEVAARFTREARASGTINSENVVQILDAGTDSETGRGYMVMEILEGNNLQWLSKKLGAMTPDGALRIVAQACNGLMAAHDAGVIHRDVKLANLFLAEHPEALRVKVLDFGIAKFAYDQIQESVETQLTQTGSMLGSPHYMSPEQGKGLKSIDHRTDIWSMGVVLYRLLAGRHPYEAPSFGQLLVAICTTSVPHIQDVAPWVSPEIAAIVHHALRRDPNERFSTTREMLEQIDRLLPHGRKVTHADLRPVSEEEKKEVAPRLALPSVAPSARSNESAVVSSLGGNDSGVGDFGRSDTGTSAVTHGEDVETRLEFRTSVRKSGGASWRSVALVLGVATIGGLVATQFMMTREPAPAQQTGMAPVIDELSGSVQVEPADAQVLLEGQPISVSHGRFELAGAAGSIHRVELRKGDTTETFEVVITADGAKPSRLTLDIPKPGGDELATDDKSDPDAKPNGAGKRAATPRRPIVAATPPPAAPQPRRPPPKKAPPPPPSDRIGGTDAFN